MKLLGCTWSSQDVQHEALSLSLSLSLSLILQRLSWTELERSELCDHHYSDSSNPNKRTQIDVLPSCSSKGGGEIWLGTKIQGKLSDSLTSTKLRRRASHTEANKKDQSKKLKNNIPAAKKKNLWA